MLVKSFANVYIGYVTKLNNPKIVKAISGVS